MDKLRASGENEGFTYLASHALLIIPTFFIYHTTMLTWRVPITAQHTLLSLCLLRHCVMSGNFTFWQRLFARLTTAELNFCMSNQFLSADELRILKICRLCEKKIETLTENSSSSSGQPFQLVASLCRLTVYRISFETYFKPQWERWEVLIEDWKLILFLKPFLSCLHFIGISRLSIDQFFPFHFSSFHFSCEPIECMRIF